ncbi:MAG: TerD family protein [Romboutsia sp.]
MSINLKKGQKIDLKKVSPGLSNIRVGLGWDPVQVNGGFLKSLFGGAQSSVDCDASVFMLNKDSSLDNFKNIVYFGNLKSSCKSVIHSGDNLTGDGAGDDEQILVNLDEIPSNINNLLFVVNIYNCVARKQHFGMIKNAFIRVVDTKSNKEIARYNLTDDYSEKTALVVGNIYREGATWQFGAIGQGTKDTGLKDMMQNLDKIEYVFEV